LSVETQKFASLQVFNTAFRKKFLPLRLEILILYTMALRFSFFKIPQHKRFEYTPRIWDPAKEEREERLKKIREELGIINNTSGGKPYIPNIKGSFRREYEQNRKGKKQFNYNRIRSYIIIGTILLLCIIFFYFTRIFSYLFNTEKQGNSEYIEQMEFYE
jgi:hypothetical protein